LAGALLAAAFGELVRRGVRWSRPLVVVLAAALSVVGVASLPGTVRDLEDGFVWSAVPTAILVTVAPLMGYWLHLGVTRAWFAAVSSDVARRRHGGLWVVTLVAVAVGSGLLVAYAEARRH